MAALTVTGEVGAPSTVDAAAVAEVLARVRARRPLIHNIANEVAAAMTTNALLAIGASPAMVIAPEEVAEFVARADALVINIGTLTAARAEAMRLAAAAARERRVPWVLDPVGAGATAHRTRFARELLQFGPSAIRGNASEIAALGGFSIAPTRGVDATLAPEAVLAPASALARSTRAVVAVTGAVDHVTDGERVIRLANGDPLMTRVTALGCAASALVGPALAVEPRPLIAVVAALTWIGVAGELAAASARGPGTLQTCLLDAVYALDAGTLEARARIA